MKLITSMYVLPDYDGFCGFVSKTSDCDVMHSHDYYEIFLLTAGCADHLVNKSTFPLQTGSLGFVRSKDCHYFKRDFCEFFNFIFTPELFREVTSFLGNGFDYDSLIRPHYPKTKILSQEKLAMFIDDLEKFIISPTREPDNYNAMFRSMLIKLITEFFYTEDTMNSANNYPKWLHDLLLDMQKEKNYIRGLPAMYEISRYSPEYLSRIFKKYLDKTPTEFVNYIRIKNASKKLIYTDMPVIEVAQSVGFDTLSHFYHLFKGYFRISPVKYRQTYRVMIK